MDTKELRRKLRSGDLIDHIDIHANVKPILTEILGRLEAAEKERDALRAALRHEADCVEAAMAEIKSLRAKIEEMEKQEPVGKIVAFGESLHEPSWRAGRLPPLMTELYALPGAKGEEK